MQKSTAMTSVSLICDKSAFAIGNVTPTGFAFRIIVVLAHTESAVYHNGAPNVALYEVYVTPH